MNRSRFITSALSPLLTIALITAVDSRAALAQPAQADSPEPATSRDLAKKLVNPLTDMVSVPLQFNWMNNVGPEKEMRNVVYFQPVVPMSISESWNLVGRWMMPYISQPATYGGSSGLGDVMAQAFFAPKLKGTFSWGVGPMLTLPISSNRTLGYGQWAAGPTGAVMKQSGGMTYGLLMNNIWSFAKTGTADRPGINMGYIQPVIAHTSRSGVTVMLSTETIVDWKAANKDDRWSVPITTAVSKIVKFGMYPMSVQLGGGYYVVRPENGPNWQLRTTFTLLMPKR
jgi:hypothetical protein